MNTKRINISRGCGLFLLLTVTVIVLLSLSAGTVRAETQYKPYIISSPGQIDEMMKQGKGLVFTGGSGDDQHEYGLVTLPEDGLLYVSSIKDSPNDYAHVTLFYNTNRKLEAYYTNHIVTQSTGYGSEMKYQNLMEKGTYYLDMHWGTQESVQIYIFYLPMSKGLTVKQTLSKDKTSISIKLSSPLQEYVRYNSWKGTDFLWYGGDPFDGNTMTVTENGTYWFRATWVNSNSAWNGLCVYQKIKVSGIVPQVDLDSAEVTGITNKTYTGQAVTQEPRVVVNGNVLQKGTDYTLEYADNVAAGTATVEILGKGRYIGSVTKTFTVGKAANTLKVSGKTASVKYKKLKKKKQTAAVKKVLKVSGAKGKVTYKKKSGNKKITVSKTNGKVTVKKGLKKGTYKVKVKVKAAGNSNYKAVTKTVTFRIKVK